MCWSMGCLQRFISDQWRQSYCSFFQVLSLTILHLDPHFFQPPSVHEAEFFFLFDSVVQKASLMLSSLQCSSLRSLLFQVQRSLAFSHVTSRLHSHFILVKISLHRLLADCCSCSRCLQSDDESKIKACHHYLINLKLNSFWSSFVSLHKPMHRYHPDGSPHRSGHWSWAASVATLKRSN